MTYEIVPHGGLFALRIVGAREPISVHPTTDGARNAMKLREARDRRSFDPNTLEDEDDEGACTDPGGHEFVCTGTAYGGDDESYHGEGRSYCIHCGADGDA